MGGLPTPGASLCQQVEDGVHGILRLGKAVLFLLGAVLLLIRGRRIRRTTTEVHLFRQAQSCRYIQEKDHPNERMLSLNICKFVFVYFITSRNVKNVMQ